MVRVGLTVHRHLNTELGRLCSRRWRPRVGVFLGEVLWKQRTLRALFVRRFS